VSAVDARDVGAAVRGYEALGLPPGASQRNEVEMSGGVDILATHVACSGSELSLLAGDPDGVPVQINEHGEEPPT